MTRCTLCHSLIFPLTPRTPHVSLAQPLGVSWAHARCHRVMAATARSISPPPDYTTAPEATSSYASTLAAINKSVEEMRQALCEALARMSVHTSTTSGYGHSRR